VRRLIDSNRDPTSGLCTLNLEETGGPHNGTAFNAAARNGHAEILRILLSTETVRGKVDVQCLNVGWGHSALHQAASFNQVECVRVLCQAGADVHFRTPAGKLGAGCTPREAVGMFGGGGKDAATGRECSAILAEYEAGRGELKKDSGTEQAASKRTIPAGEGDDDVRKKSSVLCGEVVPPTILAMGNAPLATQTPAAAAAVTMIPDGPRSLSFDRLPRREELPRSLRSLIIHPPRSEWQRSQAGGRWNVSTTLAHLDYLEVLTIQNCKDLQGDIVEAVRLMHCLRELSIHGSWQLSGNMCDLPHSLKIFDIEYTGGERNWKRQIASFKKVRPDCTVKTNGS